MITYLIKCIVFLSMTILFLGCNSSTTFRSNLSGKVSYKGQNLTIGTLEFYPVAGGEPVRAVINREGSFRLTEALSGEYKIAIKTPARPTAGKKAINRPNAPDPVFVPKKYSDPATSGLKTKVQDQDSTFNIELTD